MINQEEMQLAVNYLQRINYGLKRCYYYMTTGTINSFNRKRILNFSIYETFNSCRNFDLTDIFDNRDLEVVLQLPKYTNFVLDKCFIEQYYDLQTILFDRRVDEVNSQLRLIVTKLRGICFKLETYLFNKTHTIIY